MVEYDCQVYKAAAKKRQNLKTCLCENQVKFANLAGTGAQRFAGTSVLRPELISQAMERCLRWHLTLPRLRCPLRENVAIKKENQKKEISKPKKTWKQKRT